MKAIKDMSVIELKAVVFDLSDNIQRGQNEMIQLRQIILQKQKEEKPKGESKDVPEDTPKEE